MHVSVMSPSTQGMSIPITPYSLVPSLLLTLTNPGLPFPLCARQSLVLFLLLLAIYNMYIHIHMISRILYGWNHIACTSPPLAQYYLYETHASIVCEQFTPSYSMIWTHGLFLGEGNYISSFPELFSCRHLISFLFGNGYLYLAEFYSKDEFNTEQLSYHCFPG